MNLWINSRKYLSKRLTGFVVAPPPRESGHHARCHLLLEAHIDQMIVDRVCSSENETHLRIYFIQSQHKTSEKFVAWSVFCVEIDRRSAKSTNQRVYLKKHQIRTWFMKRMDLEISEWKWIYSMLCLGCANRMQDALIVSEHLRRFQEYPMKIEEQTIYSQPVQKRTWSRSLKQY